METRAIVAEYNPFHNGHAWQVQQIRQEIGPKGCIIAIMSGDHVQRGGPAVLGKWPRTSLALSGGVDLVLELPAIYATQSAQYFADGAVRTIQAIGICRDQAAGASYPESDWYDLLPPVLTEEPPAYKEALQEALAEGQGFAAARSLALSQILPDGGDSSGLDLQQFLRASNDNLNLAYRTAALRYAPKLKLHRLPRVDGSATAVRDALRSLPQTASGFSPTCILKQTAGLVPAETAAALAEAGREGLILLEDHAFPALASMLRARSAEDLEQHPGMGEGMARRLKNLVAASGPASASLSGLLDEANSRRFPTSRVRRALFSALLGITRDDLDRAAAAGPQYIRVLGFSKQGRYALKLMRRLAKVPVVTKASDFLEYSEFEHSILRRQAELDLRSTDIRAFLCGKAGGSDFAESVIMS